MIHSVIDIGTNTMLLLIGDYDHSAHKLTTILDIQRVPRLGKGVDSNRNILPESVEKAISILNEYKGISKQHNSEKIIATATSFIRDSNNRNNFLTLIKNATGIEIEILSGDEEARCGFLGAVFDKIHLPDENICTIDIGGGSTEIVAGKTSAGTFERTSDVKGKSIDVGSVRLNEKFLSKHPPTFENIVNAETFVLEQLTKSFQSDKFDKSDESDKLIGVAGTITTLGAIKLGLNKFDASKIDNMQISLDEIEHIFTELVVMPLEELYGIGDFMEGRADIIAPGILILKTFMSKFGFDKITVSTKGLRYGIFLREVSKHKI